MQSEGLCQTISWKLYIPSQSYQIPYGLLHHLLPKPKTKVFIFKVLFKHVRLTKQTVLRRESCLAAAKSVK